MASGGQDVQPAVPLSTAIYNGFMVRLIQTIFGSVAFGRRWYQWAFLPPPDEAPTLVKTYGCRPSLAVR